MPNQNNLRIYEIDQAIAAIFDAMTVDETTGEITLDEDALAALQEQRTLKLENAALYVKDLDALAKGIREEEKTLAERRKTLENKAARIRDWIAFNLGGEKIETARVKISTRKGTASAKVDDPYKVLRWFNENIVKAGYDVLTEEERKTFDHVIDLLDIKYADPAISKIGLKKLFEEGFEIDGAHIEAGKPSLLIK